MKKILILAANPRDTKKLSLTEEVEEIQNAHKRAKYREEIEIIPKLEVRVKDLQDELLSNKPNIVHFSGHGAGDDGLILQHVNGVTQFVSSQALAGLFKLCKDYVECVVLNSCYTTVQAEAIHQYINCVVGMNNTIGDRAAINFAIGFHSALMNGESYQKSFEFGCNAIDLQNIPEYQTPQIKIRDFSASLISKEIDAQLHPIKELSGEQRQKLRTAIKSAYPRRNDLEIMVSEQLNEKLNEIAEQGNLNDVIVDLIEWAEAQGKLKQLVEGAYQGNPGNPKLQAVRRELFYK